jgi:LysR family transcriptional regulator, glycine cleavage system transcriptional activator
MRKLPPLVELRAFEAAARRLSFKDAAAELGVTPTAISHQIHKLEKYCGQPLFRRRPRPLALTWTGEQLFPVIRDGLENFADALAMTRAAAAGGRLRVTATNAFAARWLVPYLRSWRKVHPRVRIEVVGTDAVLNLKAGDADIAIRYGREPPPDLSATELTRDTFHLVASPSLVASASLPMRPDDIAAYPLIECEWPPHDPSAPTWRRWETIAREKHPSLPSLADAVSMSFREELHAIEAIISGQGIGICSDVLTRRELATGALICVSDIGLPGYGFYVVHRSDHPKAVPIKAFSNWMRATVAADI